jgi:3'-phosphoadenosine 5'-phosphosulfate sulfotransferase (PAPS reductase)/FAD synthetase
MELSKYDWIVINSSAGKDSQVTLDVIYNQAVAQGVDLSRLVVVHCDLGRVEWAGTRELAEEQARHYGLRFEVMHTYNEDGQQWDLLQHTLAKGMFPFSNTRWCTSDHKRGPVGRLLTQLKDETIAAWRAANPGQKVKLAPHVNILNCLGLRAAESEERKKMLPVELNKRFSNSLKTVTDYLPIHAWSTDAVWAHIKASGVRYHEAYDLGMTRLSCVFCFYAGRDQLLLAGRHNRALLAAYVDVETKIGFTFTPDLALADIQAELMTEDFAIAA